MEKITKNNVVYMPQENIKSFLRENLKNSDVVIYETTPDLTSRSFRGFPLIIMPNQELSPVENPTLKGNIQYSQEINGRIVEDVEFLVKGNVRQIKQDILNAFTDRDNKGKLANYGISVAQVSFMPSDMIPELIDTKKVIVFEFKITYALDVFMSA
jgi:hypothetical protein